VAELARNLRHAGISCQLDLDGKSMKSQLKAADKCGAKYALLIGDDELASGEVTVKNLSSSEQSKVAFGAVAAVVK